MINLGRSIKTHNVTPEKRPEKFVSLHQNHEIREVRFPSNYLSIIELNAGIVSRQQEKSNSKEKSNSLTKSRHIFPYLSIPQSLKRQQRKTDSSIFNPSLQCRKVQNEKNLHEKMKEILLKSKDQAKAQKRESKRTYRLAKPGKLLALKKTENTYSMIFASKDSKDLQKTKENLLKLPDKSSKVILESIQNELLGKQVKLPKLPLLRKKRIQTTLHIKVL